MENIYKEFGELPSVFRVSGLQFVIFMPLLLHPDLLLTKEQGSESHVTKTQRKKAHQPSPSLSLQISLEKKSPISSDRYLKYLASLHAVPDSLDTSRGHFDIARLTRLGPRSFPKPSTQTDLSSLDKGLPLNR